MPVYDYECNACHKSFELSLSLEDRVKKDCDLKKCPFCRDKDVRAKMTFGGTLSSKGKGHGGEHPCGSCPSANFSSPCGGGGCGFDF